MKSNRFKKPLVISLVVLGLLILAGLIGTPYLIGLGLERWITSQGPEIGQVENIDFNPFSGRLSMDNLVVETRSGRTFNISHASLEFSWKQLFKKQLYLKELVLQDTYMLVDQLDERGLRVGGLILRELAGTAGQSDTPGWEVGVERFILENAQIRYDTPELKTTYFIDQYALSGLETWNKKKAVKMAFNGRINESPVRVDAEVVPFGPAKSWKGSIVLQKGSLELVSQVRGLQEYAPSGTLDLDLQLDAQMQEDNTITLAAEGKIAFENLLLNYEQYGLQQAQITWQGSIKGERSEERGLAMTVDGQLAGTGLGVDDSAASLQLLLAAFNWQGKTEVIQQEKDLSVKMQADMGASGINANDIKNDVALLSLEKFNFQLDAQMQEDSTITLAAEGKIAFENLLLNYEQYGLQQAQITWQGSIKGERSEERGLAMTVDGQLAGTGLGVDDRAASLQLLLAAFNWQGKTEVIQQEKDLSVKMQADMGASGINANDTKNNTGLLSLEKFNFAGIEISGLENILVEQMDLQGLRLVEKKSGALKEGREEASPLIQTAAIEIRKTSLQGTADISIDAIRLQDFAADIRRDKTGKLQAAAPSATPSANSAEQSAPKAGEDAAEAKPLTFRIGSLRADGNNSIRFADESLRRPFRTTFKISELEVSDYNSTDTDSTSRFKIKGQVGDYGEVVFGGTVKPGHKPISIDTKGTIGALDMVPFSSYTGKGVGYNVTSGQLDADISMKIDKGMMDGIFDLRMRNLEVAQVDPEKEPEVDKQMNVPLGSALSMLRNKKDEINLELKLQGDITKPEFGIQDAINQALAKAMQFATLSYLKYTLQPFGTYIAIAEVVGKAGKEMSKVGLDPVLFPAGAVVLDETANQYLGKIKELLDNRPKLRIEICGRAVEKDRAALIERRLAAQKKEAGKSGQQQLAVAEITIPDEVLLDFAGERAKLVKESLVKQHGIDHERIYLCLSSIDEDPEKEPFVELLLD